MYIQGQTYDICGMTYLKTELLRDLPRSDCFRKASACFRAHSPVQFFSATTIDISAFTYNQGSVQKNRGSSTLVVEDGPELWSRPNDGRLEMAKALHMY